MKKLDLVKLINETPYKKNKLESGLHGIVVDFSLDFARVLFFNPHNYGDYAIVSIKTEDLTVEQEKLPVDFQNELFSNLDNVVAKAKDTFEPIKIKAYETVELLVEDKKYAKFGIHKGAKGCVMEDYAVQNYVLVDFSGIDKQGEYYGDCISVKIDDLKVVEI